MSAHVYNNFWLLHYARVLHINFDQNSEQFVKVRGWYKKVLTPTYATILFLFCADGVQYVLRNVTFSFLEILFLVQIPVFCVCFAHYILFMYFDSEQIIRIIEALHTIDKSLIKFSGNSKQNKLIKCLIYANNLSYVVIILLCFCGIYCHFHSPNLRMYVIPTLLAPFPGCMIAYLISCAFLLGKRTNILNKVIIDFAIGDGDNKSCHVCRNLYFGKRLCQVHQLRYIVSIYTLILNICRRLETLNNLIILPTVLIVFLESPAAYITVITTIFMRNNSLPFLKAFIINAHITLTLAVCYLGAVAYDVLREELENVGRNIHKLNLKYCNDSKIDDNIIVASIYHMQIKPKFELANIYKMGCNNLSLAIHSIILMAMLIMHTDYI